MKILASHRALLLLACATVLASCAAGSTATTLPASRSPQSVQLRLSDVPAGFYLAGVSHPSQSLTAQEQGLDPTQYVSHGGEPSVAERFLLRNPATTGLTFIASQVIPFRSVADAAWGFRQLRTSLAHSGTIGTVQEPIDLLATPTPLPTTIKSVRHPVAPPPTPYQPEQIPPLGDADAGFRNTSAAYAGEYVFDNQVVLFRQGRYCVVVHISGNYGQVPVSEALALARKIDRRIRSG